MDSMERDLLIAVAEAIAVLAPPIESDFFNWNSEVHCAAHEVRERLAKLRKFSPHNLELENDDSGDL